MPYRPGWTNLTVVKVRGDDDQSPTGRIDKYEMNVALMDSDPTYSYL